MEAWHRLPFRPALAARPAGVRGQARRRAAFWWFPALLVISTLFGIPTIHAAEVIPPRPENHFNDYAGVVSTATATQLDQELTQFERDTSNQLIVAIYPRMQSDSSVSDYAVRVAQQWGVGQKDRKNGAVLFVFQQSHSVWIATGYGLEGTLPDALCKQIIEDEIIPRFRAGDFDGGLKAGVQAMMAATRGEYHGTGRTVRETTQSQDGVGGNVLLILFAAMVIISSIASRFRRASVYGRTGLGTMWWFGGWGGGGGGSGGGNWGGGGSFSGGGGSFGGGGAGGTW